MDHGRILTVKTPDALRAEAPGALVEIIAHPKRKAAEWLAARPEVEDVESFGERLHVRLREEAGGAQAAPASEEATAERLAEGLRAVGPRGGIRATGAFVAGGRLHRPRPARARTRRGERMIPALTVALAVSACPTGPEAGGACRLTLAEAVAQARAASPTLGSSCCARGGGGRRPAGRSRGTSPHPGPLGRLQPQLERRGVHREAAGAARPRGVSKPPQPGIDPSRGLPARLHRRPGGGQIDSAEAQREAARHDRIAGSADLDLEVASSYWNLVALRESERVLREAIVSYEAHLKDATNMFETGLAARNDLLAVQVERDRAELDRLQAEAEAEVENANLVRLLDLPPSTRVEPVVEAEPPASRRRCGGPRRPRSRRAPGGARLARPGRRGRRVDPRGSCSEAAPGQRAGPLRLREPEPAHLPPRGRCGATPGAWGSAFPGPPSTAAGPPPPPLERRHRPRPPGASSTTSCSASASRSRPGPSPVRTARASRQVAARSVESARENVKVSQDRYQAGVSPSSDLLDAETRLLRAGLDETLATTRLRVASAQLDRAVGR